MPSFRLRSRVEAPCEQVFRWHARPGALERLVPPWEDVRIIERRGGIEDGARTVISLRKGLLRVRWTAEHRDYVPGRQFVDEQVEGPFAAWRHAHRFTPEDDAGCTIEDEIDYRLPFGALGERLAGPAVRRDLERGFAFRHRRTAEDLARHTRFHDRQRLRVAITGSSGLIGSNLWAFLSTGGHRVQRVVRRATRPGADEIYWNPRLGELEPMDLAGIDAIVHLAGRSLAAWRWTPAIKRSIEYSRIASTHLLCETLARMDEPPGTLICASAVGFYGDRGDEPVHEESEAGGGFLAELCERWEAACEPARQSGVRVVNIRTAPVLTASGGMLRRLLTPFRLGLGGVLGSGRQYMSWISLDDLLAAILHSLYTPDLSGPVNAVSPSPLTNREFTKTLGDVLDRPTLLGVPASAIRAIFGEMGQALFLESARVEPRRLQDTGFRYLHPDLASALHWELGR